MAVYTDVLLASERSLRDAFRGWGQPLATPRLVPGRNPFTGATTQWEDWTDPDGPPDDAAPLPDLSALRVLHWKGVDPVKWTGLASAAALEPTAFQQELLRPALVAPRDYSGSLHAIPERLVDVIASADVPTTSELAVRWAAITRDDLATIEAAAARDHELRGWTPEVFRELCTALATHVKLRADGERLYLHVTY